MDTKKTSQTEIDIKVLANFGRFQVWQYFLICLPVFTVSMAHVNYIFVAEIVEYRCRVSECESENPSVETPHWWPDEVDTKCYRPIINDDYKKNNDTCSNTTFIKALEECHEWIYVNNNSIVAELNLGCQTWKATLVGSIHNAGMIISMMFTGWIADKIGRKPTLILCAIGGAVGVIKIFLTNYNAYVFVEFLESVLASGLYTVAVVLLIEVGGETKRVLAGVIFSYACYVGEVVFALAAVWLKYWKYLILFVYTPMTLYVFYNFILKESTRWQMLRGKIEETKETFKSIVKINKLPIATEEIYTIKDKELREKFDIQEQKETETFINIIGSKEMMIRLAVTSVCFFSSSFLYYGSMVHSVLLPGNKYTNFVLAALTSFPGDLLAYYSCIKFGRKITLQCAFFASAVFLLAQFFAPDSASWLKVLLFLLGKLAVVVCFSGIYTYSLELFPTSVRATLFGFGSTCARFGSMLAPLTPLLVSETAALPSILFSSTSVISAVVLCFTPETKHLPLYDTIAQVEAAKEKMFTHL